MPTPLHRQKNAHSAKSDHLATTIQNGRLQKKEKRGGTLGLLDAYQRPKGTRRKKWEKREAKQINYLLKRPTRREIVSLIGPI